MRSTAADLARHLARNAEAVCRHYLPHGQRSGRYWIVGDVHDTPGRSLYVRLYGPEYGPGAAGKWTDAANSQHGDLLDLIALNRDLRNLGDTIQEARRFLALPQSPSPRRDFPMIDPTAGSTESARRLFAAGRPVPETAAETYLRARGITAPLDWPALRFHPAVYYRKAKHAPLQLWPALLAAVTTLDGAITGVQRTWLDRGAPAKAPIAEPRRAIGHLLGNGVRFGQAIDIAAAGEGIETMLALNSVLPTLPMIAALSANHLTALELPRTLRRLYIARDNDAAGRHAAEQLRTRYQHIETIDLVPFDADFNLDLCHLGAETLSARITAQLHPSDRHLATPPSRTRLR